MLRLKKESLICSPILTPNSSMFIMLIMKPNSDIPTPTLLSLIKREVGGPLVKFLTT